MENEQVIAELVNEFEILGVQLWVEDGSLRFRGPSKVMTDERKESLRKHKEALISLLSHASPQVLVHDEEHRYDAFPLTNIQEAYLLGRNTNYETGGVGCHAYTEIRMWDVSRSRLETAWHTVIARHDMLHAVIYPDCSQKVLRDYELPPVSEYSASSEADYRERVLETRSLLSHKLYTTDVFPLFDLEITTYADESTLHFSFDMLIADFASIQVILDEFMICYLNEEGELTKLDVTFRDTLLYKKRLSKDLALQKRFAADKKYWLDRIDHLPLGPELPVERVISNKNVRFEQRRLIISAEDWKKMIDCAKQMRVTPSALILAAYAEVLGRWSRTKTFCLNLTTMNRTSPYAQAGSIVGDFTDVTVMEISPEAGSTFIDRIKSIHALLWSDLGHNSFSGIQVLREMARHHGRNVVMPVVYTNTTGMKGNEARLPYEISYSISQTPQVWIDCQVSDYKDGISVNWDVRKDVFRDDVLDEMFEAFFNLLSRMIEPMFDWGQLSPVLLSKRYNETINCVNATDAPIADGTLIDGFLRQVEHNPTRIALICGKRTYAYEELSKYITTVQRKVAAAGVKQGDRVCISLEKSVWQIAAILGVMSCGAAYVPIKTDQPLQRQKLIFEESQAALWIVDRNICTDSFDVDGGRVLYVQDFEIQEESNRQLKPEVFSADACAYIIYTSGSTGRPKGVVIKHRAALNTVLDINERFGINEDDRILGLSDSAFDLSVYDIFGAFEAGAALVLPEPERARNPEHWLWLVEEYEVSIWNTVPALMRIYIDFVKGLGTVRKGPLRLVLLSGDWIPAVLPNEIKAVYSRARVISLGGATEASIWSIYFDTEYSVDEERIPYGVPLKNQKVLVLDKNLDLCPCGVVGMLYIAGAGLADEYFSDAEKTGHSFIFHPLTQERLYCTGDIGRYRKDGIIEFLGREDAQIKIHGNRVEVGEIESILKAHPKICDAVVIPEQDKQRNYRISAFAQPKESIEEKRLRDEIAVRVKTCCNETKNEAFASIDNELLNRWMWLADKATLLTIMEAMEISGLFRNESDAYSLVEIGKAVRAIELYEPLLLRWLQALCREGILQKNGKGEYSLVRRIDADILSEYKTELIEIEGRIHNSQVLVDYLHGNSERLLKVMAGEETAKDLIFPQGKLDNALSAYQDNLITRCFNGIVHKSILQIVKEFEAEDPEKTIRILEVGAGVGGTSNRIIPTLNGSKVNYLFTDISNFFLNEAKKRFEEFAWVEYGLYDVSEPYSNQGLSASSVDIILCANVLHNTKNGPKDIARLCEMLTPRGFFIVVDTVKEPYSLLTSMGFEHPSDMADSRLDENTIFFPHSQWLEMIQSGGLEILCDYPDAKSELNEAGQHLFISRLKTKQQNIASQEIRAYLNSKLPHYMIPQHIEIIRTLPLTSNGKVDRMRLCGRGMSQSDGVRAEFVAPVGEKEELIAAIWSEVLNRKDIGRGHNFYEIGGDSLTVAQVVAKMKERLREAECIDWNVLLQMMIEEPTIEAIARRISEQDYDSNHASSGPYRVLLPESDTMHKEIVFFSDGTGTLSIYETLIALMSARLESNTRVSGFQIDKAIVI